MARATDLPFSATHTRPINIPARDWEMLQNLHQHHRHFSSPASHYRHFCFRIVSSLKSFSMKTKKKFPFIRCIKLSSSASSSSQIHALRSKLTLKMESDKFLHLDSRISKRNREWEFADRCDAESQIRFKSISVLLVQCIG